MLTDTLCQLHHGNSDFVLLESSAQDSVYKRGANGDRTTECDRFKTNGNYICVTIRLSSRTIQFTAVALSSIETVL